MRAAICDDEQACLEAEEKLIKEAFMQKDINCGIDLYKTPDELLASDIKYDMIFLDVEMKGMNGIETADKIHLFSLSQITKDIWTKLLISMPSDSGLSL